MHIPMVDLHQQYLSLKDEIDQGISAALTSTQFILGPNVTAFEEEAADYLGVKYCLGVNSGTDALHLSLLAAGIKPGDEVITTPFTFFATVEAICYVGAKPVFVDIDPQTFNLDTHQLEAALTDKTRALMPVHIFGQPANLQAIKDFCQTHQLKLIEDCAQSFGAHVEGLQTGSWGDFGAFSFFPSKNLGCYGDGGLITTSSEAAYNKLKVLRNHGMSKPYHYTEIGYNSRLDELQAVILRTKLKHVDGYNKRRREVAHTYRALLADTEVTTPAEDGLGLHVYHQYVCLHPHRDALVAALKQAQIGCAIYYPIPLHRQDFFLDNYKHVQLPVVEAVTQTCFALPIFPEMSQQQIKQVCDVIKATLGH